jgi:hypothetical protein
MNWFSLMPTAVVLSLVRHFLTTAGGSLVASGLVTDGDLQTGVGAVLTLVGIVLAVVDKKKAA